MEYVTIAYGLIFVVILGYSANLWRRMQAIKREQALLEAKNREA
ncbi:MAG: heme exporter protein CcmD [Chloroflexi bacterium]|nr:heme exporter protein CcmD [Chloroflexota bacterium]